MEDGTQIIISFKKENKTQSIHLSNYYHVKVGKMMYLINSLVADKYKVRYDKEKLIADHKRCNENK